MRASVPRGWLRPDGPGAPGSPGACRSLEGPYPPPRRRSVATACPWRSGSRAPLIEPLLAVGLLQRPADLLEIVRARERRRSRSERHGPCDLRRGLLRAHVAVLGHLLQHIDLAGFGGPGVGDRVLAIGRLRNPGQHRRLTQGQVSRALAEVVLRGLLDAVAEVPEEDLVQVEREDVVLGEVLLEPTSQDGLFDLSAPALLGREQKRLHHLLGDGGGAAQDLSMHRVHEEGMEDVGIVEAGVVVEVGILGADHRLLEQVGDLVFGEDGAALVEELPTDQAIGAGDLADLLGLVVGEAIKPGEVAIVVGKEPDHRRNPPDAQEEPCPQQSGDPRPEGPPPSRRSGLRQKIRWGWLGSRRDHGGCGVLARVRGPARRAGRRSVGREAPGGIFRPRARLRRRIDQRGCDRDRPSPLPGMGPMGTSDRGPRPPPRRVPRPGRLRPARHRPRGWGCQRRWPARQMIGRARDTLPRQLQTRGRSPSARRTRTERRRPATSHELP